MSIGNGTLYGGGSLFVWERITLLTFAEIGHARCKFATDFREQFRAGLK